MADLPVRGISLESITAFCSWKSSETGAQVRLPTAIEWEKAARGVDGRKFPWGDWHKSDTAVVPYDGQPVEVQRGMSKPFDRSVYGAYDMGGNVREWTVTPFPENPSFYQIKGGSFESGLRLSPCAAESTAGNHNDIGFRYVVEIK